MDHLLVPAVDGLSEARACAYVTAWLDLCQEVLDEREQVFHDSLLALEEEAAVPLYDLPEGTPHPLTLLGGDGRSFREALLQVRKRQLAQIDATRESDKRIREVLKPTSRTVVRLRSQPAKGDLTGSRLGGVPYLPEGGDYPIDATDRVPLILAAQLDFSELPELSGYPTQGIFQLFVRNEPGHGLGHPGAPRGARVVFYPEVGDARPRPRAWFDFLPSPFFDDAPGAHEQALEPELDHEWICRTDHRFEALVTAAGLDHLHVRTHHELLGQAVTAPVVRLRGDRLAQLLR